MNLTNVIEGQVFSNITKLLSELGFPKATGDTKQKQIKEIKCYLAYEKTGEISRGKVTNEIVVTDIFDVPKEKVDKRINNGNKDSHSTVCKKQIDNRVSNGNKGTGAFSDILQKHLLITATQQGEYKFPYYTPYNLMCDYLCFLTYDDFDDITYNKDGYIKTFNRNEDKYTPDFYSDVEGVKDYKYAFKTEFITKIKSACKTLSRKDTNFKWKEEYLIDEELNDDEEMKDIIDDTLKEVRETVKQIYSYKNVIQIFKNEKSLMTYIDIKKNRLEALGISKLQKVFVFDYCGQVDKDKYQDIMYDFLDMYDNLKNLFETRMEKVKEKMKEDKSTEYCAEVDLAHNNMWNIKIEDNIEKEDNIKFPEWVDFINNETIIDETA